MDKITYELPLQEQTRVLIRLGHLLQSFHRHISGELSQDSIYLALKSLDDVLSVMERNNIKKYLISELNELIISLTTWKNKPNTDSNLIEGILSDLSRHLTDITNNKEKIIKIATADFMKNFRQRANIAGGLSMIDFPRLYFWLQHDLERVDSNLDICAKALEAIYAPTRLVLKLVRQSSYSSKHTAQEGFFQQTVDKNLEYKLIRVILPITSPCFAEVSGGRYHVTVRMMQDSWLKGISVYKHDVPFTLEKCRL